jgi:hypothetical protein
MFTEVAERKRTEQGIGDDMCNQVSVACRFHPSGSVDLDSGQPNRTGTTETMGIEAPANSDS